MENNSLTIHLSEEEAQLLDQAARQRHQMILQALEDGDQNCIYPQADMVAWAAGLAARNHS